MDLFTSFKNKVFLNISKIIDIFPYVQLDNEKSILSQGVETFNWQYKT